ncbi:Phosphoglycolate phosphatase, HAD superfamily [Caminicella sporogenes DSM 14501]|uniref:Phosphoglycolate phosphatase, HAD superfamily n=1 Tax=Caminicella sporogenes DSM 14501 TaxID=1121266 RepID=A0A1M6N494_9FIRM|nr:HAD family hydrolase [Caminicella sporogenes]RKD22371.1 hypothetical protein BET04_04880 [Caminicella sporogenes]SHJ90433.1 Phosphoglycolate phosphatase, HAD superfamily [Caminicella sporogenes DSM 14501]
MKKILLIWDIDGTLINSMGSGRKAMEKAFFHKYNIKEGFKNVSMAGRLDWHIVRDALNNNKIVEENINDFFNVYGKMLKEELKNNSSPEILPGIKEFLEYTYKNENIYHVVGTGNCEIGARLKLSHLGLNHYFEIGGFGDEDLKRWELIDKVIDRAKKYYNIDFKKEDIYVIGDTPRDIKSSKKVGVKSVAVATGPYGFDELLKYKPDYIYHDFKDFRHFLEIMKIN